MEKEIRIKTPDRHVIYGTLRIPKKKTGTLLVFVHGLTGHRNEHIFYNGARSGSIFIRARTAAGL
jgi:predicted alpha/beta-fold hydrolase